MKPTDSDDDDDNYEPDIKSLKVSSQDVTFNSPKKKLKGRVSKEKPTSKSKYKPPKKKVP